MNRQALVRFKLGLIPGIKASVYKWGGQLARFDANDSKLLMACGCNGGPQLAPQDPHHVAFECNRVKPFWEEVVAVMDACVVKGSAVEAVLWASLDFRQKCKWGLTAADGVFQPSVARDIRICTMAWLLKWLSL